MSPALIVGLAATAAALLVGTPRRMRRDLARPDGPAGVSLARTRARRALAGLPPSAEGSCLAPRR